MSSRVPAIKPSIMSEKILPAYEHNNRLIANSLKDFKKIEGNLNAITSVVCSLPESKSKDCLVKQITELQDAVDRQEVAKKHEAEVSKACLEAFSERGVPPPGDGSIYVKLLFKVLNSASSDASVASVLQNYTTSLVSVQAHRIRKSGNPDKEDPAKENSASKAKPGITSLEKKHPVSATKLDCVSGHQAATSVCTKPAAEKQSDAPRPGKTNRPEPSVPQPVKDLAKIKAKQNPPSIPPTHHNTPAESGAPLGEAANRKHVQKVQPGGFDFEAAKLKPRIRTFASKAQRYLEQKRAAKLALDGAGKKGQETKAFGDATKAKAVAKEESNKTELRNDAQSKIAPQQDEQTSASTDDGPKAVQGDEKAKSPSPESNSNNTNISSKALDLNEEGINLNNIVTGGRRDKNPRVAMLHHHSQCGSSNKRKRSKDDDSAPKKRIAMETSDMARSRMRRAAPCSDVQMVDVDSLPLSSVVPGNGARTSLHIGGVDWNDDDL